eukprot:GHVU01116754.1.p1 GENE.GHVU01116754.1~~GHVU01116754.1.p1  ORF type:complete len:421 (+),score=35.80 GHVU01116754.1:215-1477(+)
MPAILPSVRAGATYGGGFCAPPYEANIGASRMPANSGIANHLGGITDWSEEAVKGLIGPTDAPEAYKKQYYDQVKSTIYDKQASCGYTPYEAAMGLQAQMARQAAAQQGRPIPNQQVQGQQQPQRLQPQQRRDGFSGAVPSTWGSPVYSAAAAGLLSSPNVGLQYPAGFYGQYGGAAPPAGGGSGMPVLPGTALAGGAFGAFNGPSAGAPFSASMMTQLQQQLYPQSFPSGTSPGNLRMAGPPGTGTYPGQSGYGLAGGAGHPLMEQWQRQQQQQSSRMNQRSTPVANQPENHGGVLVTESEPGSATDRSAESSSSERSSSRGSHTSAAAGTPRPDPISSAQPQGARPDSTRQVTPTFGADTAGEAKLPKGVPSNSKRGPNPPIRKWRRRPAQRERDAGASCGFGQALMNFFCGACMKGL